MTMRTTINGTVATIVVPIVMSASIGFDDHTTPWRGKPSFGATRTSDSIDMGEILRFGQRAVPIASATTSESVYVTKAGVEAQDLSSTMTAEDLAVAWLSEPLIKIVELAKLPIADLPNETPISDLGIAGAVKALFDVQDVQGPQPQVVARGDGGLQLVWYTPARDLEIDVGATGKLEIVEFDGKATTRSAYTPQGAVAALRRINEFLKA
jgi:hypothetical protein